MTLLALSLIQLIHVTLLESPEFCFERCPALNPTTLTQFLISRRSDLGVGEQAMAVSPPDNFKSLSTLV